MMLSARAIEQVSEILDPADFYRENHAAIYRAALTIWGRGEAVDPLTICDQLEKDGKLDQVGGKERISPDRDARAGDEQRGPPRPAGC
jgi:replicative DNA helicase